MTIDKFKIPVSMLSPSVDPAQLGFDDTSELEPLNEIIGQERAVEALEFGLQVLSGDPAQTVATKAADFDLLIVGSHSRRGVNRFLLGSVSHSIIHQAPCSVLVVR